MIYADAIILIRGFNAAREKVNEIGPNPSGNFADGVDEAIKTINTLIEECNKAIVKRLNTKK